MATMMMPFRLQKQIRKSTGGFLYRILHGMIMKGILLKYYKNLKKHINLIPLSMEILICNRIVIGMKKLVKQQISLPCYHYGIEKEKNFYLTQFLDTEPLEFQAIFDKYLLMAKSLGPYITNVSVEIDQAVKQGKKILFEGAQGTHLDVDHGTYPFVTSSNPISGTACSGAGVGPDKLHHIIGIVKAYTTRVGEGPFPTELHDDLGEKMRRRGAEFGATTGRPRRCGWLDIVVLRHAARINGLTGVVITKLDVLDSIKTLKICTSYKYKGKIYKEFPKEIGIIEGCTPLYEEVKGWSTSTVGITDFGKLPHAAKAYIKKIQSLLGVEIQLISTGQKRDEIIQIKHPF